MFCLVDVALRTIERGWPLLGSCLRARGLAHCRTTACIPAISTCEHLGWILLAHPRRVCVLRRGAQSYNHASGLALAAAALHPSQSRRLWMAELVGQRSPNDFLYR